MLFTAGCFSHPALSHHTMKNIFPPLLFIFILFAWISSACAIENKTIIQPDHAEKELVTIIDLIGEQQIDLALFQSRMLLKKYPEFKLASLVYGDLISSQQNQLKSLFNKEPNDNQLARVNLYEEAAARINASTLLNDDLSQKIPANIHFLDKKNRYFFIVDLSKSRLYLIENKKHNQDYPKLIASHYVTMGKNGSSKQKQGDERTPVGVYKITSYLDDNQLPELYGWGAFPINYPNAWDRKHKRSGAGIWLHGVPRDTYSRPPRDSRGCLAISNDFLKHVSSYISVNTPVIIAKSLKWVEQDSYLKSSLFFQQLLKKWESSWESRQLNDYLSFYSKDFNNFKKNYKSWRQHKKNVINKAKKISIDISDLSIFQYPGEQNLISVNFYQHYQSDRYKSRGYKQQYWKMEDDGKWRIIYER